MEQGKQLSISDNSIIYSQDHNNSQQLYNKRQCGYSQLSQKAFKESTKQLQNIGIIYKRCMKKTKAINKGQKTGKKGRPRKRSTQQVNEGADQQQSIELDESLQGQQKYQKKYPKDKFKQQMIAMSTKSIRELAQLEHRQQNKQIQLLSNHKGKEYMNKSKKNSQNESNNVVIQERLELIILQKVTGYEQENSLLQRIYQFMSEEIENPSDPLNQEFVSLQLENYIVKFCEGNMIEREQFINRDLIQDEKEQTSPLRFFELDYDDFCQLIIADLSLSVFQVEILQMIQSYFKLLQGYLQFIKYQHTNIFPLQTFTVQAITHKQEMLSIILPFQIDLLSFEKSQSQIHIQPEQLDIINFFNIHWQSVIENRFKYYRFYFQLKINNNYIPHKY